MERNMKMKMIVVVGIVMIVGMAVGEAALTCGSVASALGPCAEYLKSGGAPSASCCAGVKSLKSQASTPADRRTACACLKQAAGGVDPGLASSLPSKCGVSVPYKISPSTDCSKIN